MEQKCDDQFQLHYVQVPYLIQGYDLTEFIFLQIMSLILGFVASFYGDSYLNLPFGINKDVELRLRFLTWQSHGVLFLARGSSDYLYLNLQHGYVQVEGNFGSGVITWKSLQKTNDGSWHHIELKQVSQTLTISVDGRENLIHIPGELHELNENEVFVGGMQKNINFVKKWSYFRGCLGNVEFNQYDIISNAQKLEGTAAVNHVAWTCREELKAESSLPIKFQSNSSFAAFHHLPFKHSGNLSVLFKTHTENGLLLFNLAKKGRTDILFVEILSKKLILNVNKGGVKVIVNSDLMISDGEWHSLSIKCTDNGINFMVDNTEQTAPFDERTSDFKFSGHFFLGGLTPHVLSHVEEENFELISRFVGHEHYHGCMKNLTINSNILGYQQMLVSDNLSTECGSVLGCTKNCEKTTHIPKLTTDDTTYLFDDQYVEIRGVTLREGREKIISTEHILVLLDYKTLQIRESAIQFELMRFPKHGRLMILGRRRNREVFTLLDLQGNKVIYVHDGSETTRDEVTLNMKIVSDIPDNVAEMQKSYTFILPFFIEPLDDEPTLQLQSSSQNQASLIMAKNTKLRITESIIQVLDPDTPPSSSMITAVCGPRSPGGTPGHFVTSDEPSEERTKFSFQEILDGFVWFSSGSDSSSCLLTIGGYSKRLYINTVEVSLHLNSSVLRVTQGSYIILSRKNLVVTNNVPIQEMEIRYRITVAPDYGVIQRRSYTKDTWENVDTFAQRHIDNHQIRYLNMEEQYFMHNDRFSLEASALNSTIKGLVYIHVDRLTVDVTGTNNVTIQHSQFKIITKDELQARTNDPWYDSKRIRFSILRKPYRGNLYRIHHKNITEELIYEMTPLETSDIFTQEDVNNGYVVYRLHRLTHEKNTDFIDFQVSALPAVSKMMRLNVDYVPRPSNVRFTNNVLDTVLEGREAMITKDYLYLETDDFQNFEFDVVEFPKHGTLNLVSKNHLSIAMAPNGVTRFSNEDIKRNKLSYEHDDTENDQDSFAFVASPILTPATTFPAKIKEFSGRFHIRVVMRNDNHPVREVDKTFKIVSGKERVIMTNDLSFSDPDINFDSNKLRYERRIIQNGEIVNSEDGKEIFNFTQKDIADGKVKFRHTGKETESTLMSVSDGNFAEYFMFSIEAGRPYIVIQNNTGAFVQVGEDVNIHSSNLSIETNVNVKPEDVTFMVFEEPLHGRLQLDGKSVKQFTLKDLLSGSLTYGHRQGGMGQDRFRFNVIAGEARTRDEFTIHILQGTPAQIPRVINNNVLQVQSLKTQVISKSNLQVFNTLSQPSSIVFSVQTRPSYGSIYISYDSQSTEKYTFSQWDINSKAVSYHHTQKGHRTDFFTFDVADEVTGQRLRGLTFGIEVLPPPLDIETRNLSVREGGKKPLSPADIVLKFTTPTNVSVVFHVVQQPRHGHLEFIEKRNQSLSSFTMNDLKQGRIYYVHDGSDSDLDEIVIKGRMENKEETDDQHVYIHIEAVNDEAPQIIANKGLTLWQSSMALISKVIFC